MKITADLPPEEQRRLLRDEILQISPNSFEETALKIFRYQALHNPTYRSFLSFISPRYRSPARLTEIPFLPIQFFKQHTIRTGQPPKAVVTFESSGTTGTVNSRHELYDASLYQQISTRIFEHHYGPLSNFHILALLPSYLERNNSSLVYMVKSFIEASNSEYSGFYLTNPQELTRHLQTLANLQDGKNVLVLGVTFALLDWAESGADFQFLNKIGNLLIMETGGMKGRRKEMLREEVHAILTRQLGIPTIHSEYGMTELLSQGYSKGGGLIEARETMRVLIRETNDPFSVQQWGAHQRNGGINIIDLANLDSCSFIETQDLGRFGPTEESFYVMGRFDNSDLRGCNLMVL